LPRPRQGRWYAKYESYRLESIGQGRRVADLRIGKRLVSRESQPVGF
jgi:hypothetical protein